MGLQSLFTKQNENQKLTWEQVYSIIHKIDTKTCREQIPATDLLMGD